MRKAGVVLGCLLGCVATVQSQTTKKVLFIGNSYTQSNDLAQLVDSLAIADGHDLVYEVHAPGGETFKGHAQNPAAFGFIRQQKWDYVVLQEQSQIPSFSYSQFHSECVPYAKILVDSIRANNPCAIPVFFATWGREQGDNQWDSINTFTKMNQRLDNAYTYLAKVNGAHKVAVGFAFATVKEPGGGAVNFDELYENDGSHPSLYGSYIAACMFYNHFFNTESTYNSFTAGYASFYSDYLQGIADYAYEADKKNRDFFPRAEFSTESNVGSKTIAFSDQTYGGKADMWLFGDGDSSKMQNPTHTYPDFDLYGVTLRVSNSCGFKDTLIRSVRLIEDNQNSIDAFGEGTIYVFPNPAVNMLNVAKENAILGILDLKGSVLIKINESPKSLDISKLQPGTYIVNTAKGSVQFIKK